MERIRFAFGNRRESPRDKARQVANDFCKLHYSPRSRATLFRAFPSNRPTRLLSGETHRPRTLNYESQIFRIFPFVFSIITCEKQDADIPSLVNDLDRVQNPPELTSPSSVCQTSTMPEIGSTDLQPEPPSPKTMQQEVLAAQNAMSSPTDLQTSPLAPPANDPAQTHIPAQSVQNSSAPAQPVSTQSAQPLSFAQVTAPIAATVRPPNNLAKRAVKKVVQILQTVKPLKQSTSTSETVPSTFTSSSSTTATKPVVPPANLPVVPPIAQSTPELPPVAVEPIESGTPALKSANIDFTTGTYSEALGMGNVGNTCFVNASNVALLESPMMREYLLKPDPVDTQPHPDFAHIQLNEADLRKFNAWNKIQTLSEPARTQELERIKRLVQLKWYIKRNFRAFGKEYLKRKDAIAKGNVPQIQAGDAHPFNALLKRFFDSYDRYLTEYNRWWTKNPTEDHYFSKDDNGAKQYLRSHQMESPEYINHLLSLLDQENHMSGLNEVTVNHFQDGHKNQPRISAVSGLLILPIRNASNVQQALNSYLAPVTLKGSEAVQKDNGKGKAEAQKHTHLSPQGGNAPKQILLQLERFEMQPDGTRRKIDKDVEIPPTIQLPLHDQKENKVVTKTMPLASVIMHHGGLNGGHYFTYTYNSKKDLWTVHNDSSVYELHDPKAIAKAKEDMKNNDYVLMYAEDDSPTL